MLNTYQGLHARHYDLIYAQKPYAEEAQFVNGLLGTPGTLLDLACGTGRHALELARLGWRVTGVDYSADLLERARGNAAAAGIELGLHRQDMRELDVPARPYEAITCLFDSIGYARTNDGVIATLAGARRHLAPDGRLVVEFLHAPAVLRHAEPVRVRRIELPDGGTLMRVSETTLDVPAQVMHVEYELLELAGDGSYWRGTERQSNRFFAIEEMRALMTAAGLSAEHFGPAYADGEIGEDTFHVLALAGVAA